MKTGFLTAFLLAAALALPATPAAAQHRGGGAVGGHAVPRVIGPRGIGPRGVLPSRPFFFPYRPGFGFAFYGGWPYYGYYPWGYWGYGYYPYYGYPGYYPPVGYGYGVPYGGVRIQGAPRDAQVFVDGYYAGIVDDFDGSLQRLNLESGPHRIEIRPEGGQPITFDVNVRPGETVTYHAAIR